MVRRKRKGFISIIIVVDPAIREFDSCVADEAIVEVVTSRHSVTAWYRLRFAPLVQHAAGYRVVATGNDWQED